MDHKELDRKEGWALKNWCFLIVGLEKALESPLNCKEIQPVNPKVNQPWIFIGRTDAEVKAAILWPPNVKSWLTGRDPDDGKDCRQKEKGTTEDEMVGWHHWLNEYEFAQALGAGDGQRSLACCSPWDLKELDTTEQLKWTDWCLITTKVEISQLYICTAWCPSMLSESFTVACDSSLMPMANPGFSSGLGALSFPDH